MVGFKWSGVRVVKEREVKWGGEWWGMVEWCCGVEEKGGKGGDGADC